MDTRDSIELSNCEACPKVLHTMHSMEHVSGFSEFLTDLAFQDVDSDTVEHFETLRETGLVQMLEAATGESLPDGQSFLKTLRQETARQLERLDERSEETAQTVQELITGCPGPLKMRATKGGQVITATVCTSPSNDIGFSCEDVHIDRSRSQ